MQYKMSLPREQLMTYPGYPQGHTKPKSMSTYGHLDADDLTRRLNVVLADQKARSDRRRRAQAPTAAGQNAGVPVVGKPPATGTVLPPMPLMPSKSHESRHTEPHTDLITELRRSKSTRLSLRRKESRGSHEGPRPGQAKAEEEQSEYRHVPQEAAKQFTRTTTVDTMQDGLVHKLSKRALKSHMEGVRTDRSHGGDPTLTPQEQERILRREQRRREKELERNQFQQTRILEEAAEADEERRIREEEKQLHRHTFSGELSRLMPLSREANRSERRGSTGEMAERPDACPRTLLVEHMMDTVAEDATPPDELDPRQAYQHRVDWTQSDEGKQRTKTLLSPLLRKADSIWMLRGRLGSKGSQDRAEVTTESPKSPKSGFFAKFRR